jgi:hypothetical protein
MCHFLLPPARPADKGNSKGRLAARSSTQVHKDRKPECCFHNEIGKWCEANRQEEAGLENEECERVGSGHLHNVSVSEYRPFHCLDTYQSTSSR